MTGVVTSVSVVTGFNSFSLVVWLSPCYKQYARTMILISDDDILARFIFVYACLLFDVIKMP